MLALLTLLGVALPQTPTAAPWTPANCEHLINRAGFGATPKAVQAGVELGHTAFVERLLAGSSEDRDARRPSGTLRGGVPQPASGTEPWTPVRDAPVPTPDFFSDVHDFTHAWIERMVDGSDPLRDRMTLFWHGHFVSGFDVVRDERAVSTQLEFLRANALGNFGELVRGIARDPAMLEYLNNNTNVKAHPNENWARELMELFTLGVGNYTEDDIKEVARAFTGWTDDGSRFAVNHAEHDFAPSEILGVSGGFDGDLVIDLLLAGDQCSRFIAAKLIEYFEGVAPSPARVDTYAAELREANYELSDFLRKLFLDPEFYRTEIVGQRPTAPLEYLVGAATRLEIQPPPDLLYASSALLGQRLSNPPNVKGWEEGLAWLTTTSVMARSNYVALLVGMFERTPTSPNEPAPMGGKAAKVRSLVGAYRDHAGMLAYIKATRWAPDLRSLHDSVAPFANAGERELVHQLMNQLLAVEVAPSTVDSVLARLQTWLEERPDADWLDDLTPGGLLARTAHLVLSLPEAQLN